VVGRWDGVRRRSGGEGTDIITVRKLLESQSDEDVQNRNRGTSLDTVLLGT
jgi:hypothetical protein